MIEVKLFDRLSTLTPNVYPGAAPMKYARPCVIYNRVSTDPTLDLDDDGDTANITYQVDVYSTDQIEAITLAKAIRNNLKGWSDNEVQSVAYSDRQDMIDNTTQTQLFRVMQFFKVFAAD